MNERLKEYSKKAKEYAEQQYLEAGYPGWEKYHECYAEDFEKRFAELIVQDCAIMINNLEGHEGVGDCSKAEYIKESFGIA